jgi:HlyD family secretion protein
MKKLIIIVVVLAAIGVGVGAYYMNRAVKEPEVKTGQITRGDIVEIVPATGTLEAVTTVQVGTQVGGIIQDLYADFNDIVRKGQVIARLDPTLLQTNVEQQRANVTRAEADLERLKVSLADSKQKLDRAKTLFEKQLLPRTELETAEVTVQSAEAQIRSSAAGLVQARSQLNTAQVNLAHTVIAAPIDGIVISRAVEPGQTVNAGMSAPTLFILAADLTKMQVNANIDEADVGRMRPGQVVTFRVDAYPTETFTGSVQQVRLQPTTVQNVVTYQTVIQVPNPQLKLKPGMTATVGIEVARKNNVLRIPTAATRFRPSEEMFAALKQPVPPEAQRGGGFAGRGGRDGGRGGQTGAGAPAGAPASPPAGNVTPPGAAPAPAPTQKPTAPAQTQAREPRAGSPEARGGGDRAASPGNPGGDTAGRGDRGGFGGPGGGGQGGFGGRGGEMTPEQREERRKRMEERLAAMTPEERKAFEERMAERAGGRGGFGGGGGQGGGRGGDQAQGGGRGGFTGGRGGAGDQTAGGTSGGQTGGGNARQTANAQSGTRPAAGRGRVANTPSMATGATTIDSLFGPLPTVETRGRAWLWVNKQLKPVSLRLGIFDSTNTEVISGEGLDVGSEVVTSIILPDAQPTTGPGANANNPLMGPQRGRGGPGGGGGGRGGRG